MKINEGSLIIPLDQISPGLMMTFKDADKRFMVSTDFLLYNEAEYQFTEGVYYAYELFEQKENHKTKTEWSLDVNRGLKGVFRPFSNSDTNEGMFVPNTFVGTLNIPLIKGDRNAHFQIEVHSSKVDYRDSKNLQNKLGQFRSEYQLMLEEIVEHSIDLIMQYNVPVEQTYESGTEQISDKELYQRFIFVRSLFKNQEFEEAVQKIISNPATKWEIQLEPQDIRNIRRFTSKNIKELVTGPNRIYLTKSIADLTSLPTRISSNQKAESIDTPENRFIKYILTNFQDFCVAILAKLNSAKLTQEAAEVQSFTHRIYNLLNQPFFREINHPTSLKLNSPVLQRRSGYRELLRAWLRFNVTAQLSWKFDNDQDNLFKGGKKDIASLYEYWVFFVLFRTLTEKFGDYTKKSPREWLDGLIVSDKHGLGLTLQQGKIRSFEFAHTHGKRRLTIKFYYNRSFRGNRKYAENEGSGSYSKSLKPDYTLSIWPSELSQIKSEENGSIVHIHFDAKYKVDYSIFKENKTDELATPNREEFDKLIEEDKQLFTEIETIEKEERSGIYKNVDLYKMHTYKDAIRRSGGAYVLYPGFANDEEPFRGYHEIIPGVGAFSLRPKNEGEASQNIKQFIDKVIENLEDVLSQRERMARYAHKVYTNTYKLHDPKVDKLLRQLDSTEIPDETQVLVGYCTGENHRNWISGNIKNMRYNIRYGNGYNINGKMASARYLVLYTDNDFLHQEIFRVKPDSTRIYTKDEMKVLKYKNPSHPLYLVFELAEKIQLDATYHFDKLAPVLANKLAELESHHRPFTLNLLELAQVRILNN